LFKLESQILILKNKLEITNLKIQPKIKTWNKIQLENKLEITNIEIITNSDL